MKKLIVGIVAALATASVAFAAIDSKDFTMTCSGGGTGATNSKVYVVRGEILAIRIVCPLTSTGAVLVADSNGQSILALSSVEATSATYWPRTIVHGPTGVATSPSNSVPFAIAGPLTCRVVQVSTMTATNAWTIRPIYRQ